MADFMQIVDSIFVNKSNYKNISDGDKILSFYMINKKFSIKYPKIAEYFNDRSIDKASALDMWFLYFKNTQGIPYWYWTKSKTKKEKVKKISGPDKKDIIEDFDLTENEFDFIAKHFEDELDYEIKINKRWKKSK